MNFIQNKIMLGENRLDLEMWFKPDIAASFSSSLFFLQGKRKGYEISSYCKFSDPIDFHLMLPLHHLGGLHNLILLE